KVYIVHRRDRLRAYKIIQERAFANAKIEMIWNKQVVEIKGTERGIHHLELADTGTAERSNLLVGGVFIFIGFKPNTGLVEPHFKHDAGGYFITDDRMMSSIPGLFVAGDVRRQPTRQITTAVGAAPPAAIAVAQYPATLPAYPCASCPPPTVTCPTGTSCGSGDSRSAFVTPPAIPPAVSCSKGKAWRSAAMCCFRDRSGGPICRGATSTPC